MRAEFGQDEESQTFFIFHFLNIFILTFTLEKFIPIYIEDFEQIH